MTVIAVHREPFSTAPEIYRMPEGETLEQMAVRVRSLPTGWPRHAGDAICINGKAVPRALWGAVRPKGATAAGVPIEITFHAPPMGGGRGGKNVLGLVASIGLIALSGGVASGLSLFAGAAPGSTASILGTASRAAFLGRLAGGAVMIAGSAILQALAPTPSVPGVASSDGPSPLGAASAAGNILEPNAPLPRVVGTRKVFPPFVTEPLIYYRGQDEVAEAICALAGPHKLEEIRIGAAEIEDVQGVEFETREGWPGLEPLSIITRYARTIPINSRLAGHTVRDEDKRQVQSVTGDILDALPQAKVIATRNGPDEFWIGLQFSQGLALANSASTVMRVPLRFRIRRKGDVAWVNLPEIHYAAAHLGTKRATVKFAWRDAPVNVSAASTRGWVEARIVTPGQAIAPVTAGWVADSYFDADTGGDHYVDAENNGSNDVINIIMGDDEAEFQLDRAAFPPGIYEIEMRRGYAFRDFDYSAAAYNIGGAVRDPFWFEGESAERIFQTKEGLIDELTIVRANSVWNSSPVRKGGVALIAVRATNAAVDQLSVLASGYVRDWDGTSWSDWKTTSDPAPHLFDVLAGSLNATPLPIAALDNQSFLDFRADGWTCDAVIEGRSVGEAAQIIAGSGFARLFQSEKFGVVRDRDRSADTPVQIFTPNNSSGFEWSRGYPKLPDGFRATFVDADSDYEAAEIIHPPDASRTEQVTIEGLVTEEDVRVRLQYDLDAAKYRAAFYSWSASAEAIKCRRGSLVGVVSDAISDRVFSGRLVNYALDVAGDVTAVQLDNEADLTVEPTWADIDDMSAVKSMALIGATFGVAIRRAGKVVTSHRVTPSERGADWVDLVTAATLPGIAPRDVAAIGPLGQEYRRLIVVDMTPRSLTEWAITAVSEAPEIWA